MSDKPKMYQGVRVKTTVKDLLQQQRALQTAIKTVRMKSQSLASQDVCVSSSLPGHYFDYFPQEMNSNGSFQPRAFPDSNVQMESFDNQQLISMMMPNETYGSGIVHPATSTKLWPQENHSLNMDYCVNGMAPSSPSGSLNMSSPVDYNSYSPQESYSSSCYNSPNRMDSSYGFVPEHYHYQHCNLQHCYCLSHWSGTQESICTPEYAIYGTTDCVHASPVDGSYFRRELSSSEICYL
ncbi:colorectal cancer associated 2 isoform X1 [Salmo salar]|uniref:Colorectal cancer associated 2 isoform X1 n=2 Tax=Salmo salar TaxID=8030 RepID=A0A1S3SY58_SALSA|nr:colorectal cancer associated 2 isoform X1 [Salmo salar]